MVIVSCISEASEVEVAVDTDFWRNNIRTLSKGKLFGDTALRREELLCDTKRDR